jgi:hypothetical protein
MRWLRCYRRGVGREEDLQAIAALGRQTRTPIPRWLWIAAAVVGGICAIGFTGMLLGAHEPPGPPPRQAPGPRSDPRIGQRSDPRIDQRPAGPSGLGIGLAIGLAAGIMIGFSIARQRRSHSSRNSP